MKISAQPGTSQILLEGVGGRQDILFWAPEAIITETGASSIYPNPPAWTSQYGRWIQRVTESHLFGPGNAPEVEPGVLECVGIRFPKDQPVRWTALLEPGDDQVRLSISLSNRGYHPLHQTGAAVCVRLLNAPWWSDESTWTLSGGRIASIAQLGRDAGLSNEFQAYLLKGKTVEHAFYRQFWGINRHAADRAVWVSRNDAEGYSVVVESPRAWFIHSNRGNPCTDIMAAFGDIEPGGEIQAEVTLRVTDAPVETLLTRG